MKRLRVHPDLCLGCQLCVLECSFRHEGVFGLALARLSIRSDEEQCAFTPRVCRQCGKALCLEACPQGAITKDTTTGAVILGSELCDGCGLCVEACPFEAIINDAEERLVRLCDLCQGQPSCSDTCPVGAIEYA